MFTNPLGFLALLGIPAVLAIHFLQRKSVELPVSTLFLLERTQREAISGRRVDRLIPSIPLWMQLLAVLLLTWLLVEPRYQKENSVQRVAIVIDSSASMEVFKADLMERLNEALPTWQSSASELELTVLESAPNRPRIYTGSSVDDLRNAIEAWNPMEGMIDPTQALRLARSLVSSEGTVIYLTDTPSEHLPFEAQELCIGRPISNVGFTGVTFTEMNGQLIWRALVKNYGDSTVSRTWRMISSAGSTQPVALKLEPGSLHTLQAAFPMAATDVRLELSADEFPLDDCMPLVSPAPKPLTLYADTSPAFEDLNQKLLRSLDSTQASTDRSQADLTLATYDPLDPSLPTGNAVIFVEDSTAAGSYLRGGILAEPSALMDGLNWQSLLIRETIQLERRSSDQVLLWQETRPLIFLRRLPATENQPAADQLLFNFDLQLSNVERQPAFIILLHRFAETIRKAKVAPSILNLETNQPVRLSQHPGKPVQVTHTSPAGEVISQTTVDSLPENFTTPPKPGFLRVMQGDQNLLMASLHFADTREADFRDCASTEVGAGANHASIDRNTKSDPLWQLWFTLVLGAVIIAWKFAESKSSQTPVPSVGSR